MPRQDIQFRQLTQPTDEIVAAFDKWENDPALVPFIRPNPNQKALEKKEAVTHKWLIERLEHTRIFLIYAQEQPIGEINYQIDPRHLYKKEPGTAWIGINIGEASQHSKGNGTAAMRYLEEQIRQQGLQRIELGVFAFNTKAIKLYQKLDYQEIGRIKDFTYWQGQMWPDIRMEKILNRK